MQYDLLGALKAEAECWGVSYTRLARRFLEYGNAQA